VSLLASQSGNYGKSPEHVSGTAILKLVAQVHLPHTRVCRLFLLDVGRNETLGFQAGVELEVGVDRAMQSFSDSSRLVDGFDGESKQKFLSLKIGSRVVFRLQLWEHGKGDTVLCV
jgi:hypothetical protein